MKIYTVVYRDTEGERRETHFRSARGAETWARIPPDGVAEILTINGIGTTHAATHRTRHDVDGNRLT